MPTPFLRFRLLIPVLLLCLVANMGCSRTRVEPRESPVRPFLQSVADRLDQGQAREGLEILLGRKLTATTWERAQRQLLDVSNPGARAAADECARNLALLQTTVELYQGDEEHGGARLPTALADLVRDGKLKEIPTCPAAGRDTYSAGYHVVAHGEGYRLSCSGAHHRGAGLKPGYPMLDSRFGPMVALDPTAGGFSGRLHLEIGEIRRTGSRYEVTVNETLRPDSPSPVPSTASASPQTAQPPAGAASKPSSAPQGTSTVLTLEEVPATPGTFRMVTAEKGERKGGTLAAMAGACIDALSAAPVATASREACQLEMRHLATALEMYSSDHDGQYPQRLEQLVPRYAWRLSSCQGDGSGPLPVYRVSADREQYDLSCRTHADVHLSTHPSTGGRTSRGGGPSSGSSRQDGHLGATP